MQILEHQSLFFTNVISYRSHLDMEQLPALSEHIRTNVCKLGAQLSGKLVFTENNDDYKNIEILIPVNVELNNCTEYEYKPVFKLINAVSVRHEGGFSNLEKTHQLLVDYIKKKSYQVITAPYYSIIRLEPDDLSNCIIDIYIGTNYNIL